MSTVLHPGDVALAERGEVLETLLGSCVAILLTDPRQTLGVMCHVVNGILDRPEDTRHGEPAFQAMGSLLRSRGMDIQQCQAWLYGGGAPHVGVSNVQWAQDRLSQAGIPVMSADVGGFAARRVRWTVGEMPQVSLLSMDIDPRPQ
ncbi:MAG: chemotaxis protein CheD [Burkholderiaceae bacterium]